MSVRPHLFWRWLMLGLLATLSAPSARAVEPVLEFVSGLRDRGYFDVAEQYLLSLEQKQNLPPEVRAVLPYELGVTIRDSARRLLIPEEQRVRLDEAQAAFERFAKSAPNHPLAGRANSERAKLLVEKARVDLWDADGTSDEAKKKELRDNARKLIAQAREIFTTAVEQLKQRYESFEGYIPPEQAQRLRQREAAEAEYIQAQLNLAETTYWEAQTHDVKDPLRAEQLTNAMLAFESIHTAYRSMIGGLLARLWQGKCLEEMGRIGEALGIYGELLKHDGSSPSMQALQAKAKQFELICRNHESKREYRLVNQLASEWLRSDANRRLRYSETGKGIEWEQARALEQLGQDRTVPENERTTFLNQALGIARGLARRPGPHKAPAAAMVARLTQLLGRDANEPKDFNTAYGRAEELLTQCKELSGKIQAAQDAGNYAEARQLADARSGVAAEMTRLLNLALRLADSTTDDTLRSQAELKLAIGYFYQERPYEATAVSEYFLRTHPSGQPELLRLAGQIALASLNDAYQQSEVGDRDFEKRHILRLADMLASRWPESDLAAGAHLSAGRLAWDDGDYLAAAQAWLKVPAASADFGTAQLKAGSAFLELYFRGAREEGSDRPSAEQLLEWRRQAEQHLQAGVDFETRRTPAGAENVPLIQGKLALAQLRNLEGVYQTTGGVTGALELLTAEPHSVVKAIETGPGETRPNDPASLKSRQFASHVYQQLLRAHIGLRNLEAASQVMGQLEQVGGQDSAALTEVFVQFGQQLQDELNQLRASGETERLASVREGFERFLDELYNRDESRQTFNSLLWIAETYTSLGEGTEDDLLKSTEYFNRAANAYERIITRGQSDPAFLGTPQNATVAKVRMLECRLRQRDFEAAEKVLLDVVKESPNAPNVQESGARLYQLWAESGDLSKYEYALNGRKEHQIWGWGELANRMGQHREREDLRPLYHEATYHYAQVFHQRARNESGEKRTASLRNALRVLDTFARTNRSIPDDVYDRMNTLYAAVLTDLGQPVAPLRRGGAASPGASPASTPVAANGTGGASVPTGVDVAPAEAPPPPAASNLGNILVVLVLVGLGAGAVIGIFLWTTSLAAKQRAARLAAIAAAPPKKKKVKAPAEGSSR